MYLYGSCNIFLGCTQFLFSYLPIIIIVVQVLMDDGLHDLPTKEDEFLEARIDCQYLRKRGESPLSGTIPERQSSEARVTL